eukprot:2810770-Pyramimonas_sp.AAC.1
MALGKLCAYTVAEALLLMEPKAAAEMLCMARPEAASKVLAKMTGEKVPPILAHAGDDAIGAILGSLDAKDAEVPTPASLSPSRMRRSHRHTCVTLTARMCRSHRYTCVTLTVTHASLS